MANASQTQTQESFWLFRFELAAAQSCNPYENYRPINRNSI